MAEYIEREAVLAIVGKMPLDWEYGQAVADIYDIIKNAPAVEVVRCKDCKYVQPTLDGRMICGATTNPNWVSEEHFCSYGEKEGERR